MTKDKYETIRLKNQLCFPLYLCSKEIIKKYTPILNKINLTYTQYIVMMYFWENKVSNAKDAANALLLDPSTLTPVLKTLEKKEYITKKKNKNDGRNLVLELTTKGELLKDEALIVPKEIQNCINLNDDEKIVLYKLLYKILSEIKEEK